MIARTWGSIQGNSQNTQNKKYFCVLYNISTLFGDQFMTHDHSCSVAAIWITPGVQSPTPCGLHWSEVRLWFCGETSFVESSHGNRYATDRRSAHRNDISGTPWWNDVRQFLHIIWCLLGMHSCTSSFLPSNRLDYGTNCSESWSSSWRQTVYTDLDYADDVMLMAEQT